MQKREGSRPPSVGLCPPAPPMDLRFTLVNKGIGVRTPSVRANARPAPPVRPSLRSCRQGERCKRGNRTPSVGLRPPAPPAVQASIFSAWQGERCISNDISRYKRIFRVYRFEISRVGPCVRPKPSYISVNWSLLSKTIHQDTPNKYNHIWAVVRIQMAVHPG